MTELFMNLYPENDKLSQDIKNKIISSIITDKENYGYYNLLGFKIDEIEINGDSIIFCYTNYKIAKDIYNILKLKSSRTYIQLMIIVTPLDDFPFNIVVQFINRDKNCYCNGHIPKNYVSDEERERDFLSNISGFSKVIYVGDVVKLWH